ncbi:MAG: sulfite exporter TauE/SafE family protein [Candidatus Methanodesulfokora sp.]
MDVITSGIAGFIAELVDGTLGMAFGVTANTFLQTAGFSPAVSSATIHTAEVFLTAASGASHVKLGNVDKQLFMKLVIPGTITAVMGAYLLSEFSAPWLASAVQTYLVAIGLLILLRAFGFRIFPSIRPSLLGAIGGFIDAVGGGGWGPVVTGTLIASNNDPRTSIGSVNTAEFFVTVSQSIMFFILLRTAYINYFIPFAFGGLIAAPLGAWICKSLSRKAQRLLYILVGLLLITINTTKLLTFYKL